MQNRFSQPASVARAMALLLVVAACKGDEGPVGPEGPPGTSTGVTTTVISYNVETVDAAPGALKEVRVFSPFTKLSANTKIQLVWNSHVYAGGPAGSYCIFQIRVDGVQTPDHSGVVAPMSSTGGGHYQASMTTVISGLAAGSHALSLWTQGVSPGTCADNLGGYKRTITITEF